LNLLAAQLLSLKRNSKILVQILDKICGMNEITIFFEKLYSDNSIDTQIYFFFH